MRKTKVRQILEYIRDNQPAKAKDICEAVGLELRYMPHIPNGPNSYYYYVSWSGLRAYLTKWGYTADKSKQAIKRTKDGYVLTKYGRILLRSWKVDN